MSVADDSAQSPVGAIGRVTVPIPADGPGEVLVSVRGGSEAYAAWADHPIGRNLRVIVVESISARSVIVEPFPS
ncbi:hypothetical protein ACWC0A_30985 [Streptomyces scopuliridis]|uniref:NfeD-like C-terminal domain-containing protein n=2 Tax=Streptomyces scopuliridis TaxID=452529 RepID=A0A2T7TE41_9ACTN|nr:hypothetical protein [Streptomyces scopuliridis]PVE13361.1 hypothetical protein Y717_19145 [Streptomyces scopuliridis RB72]WSB37137.1 hypothetical protein OG949_32700 [Streptomyces scopuliridis]WSC01774.1 hypothetical protein OG835_35360 [Streptomyces scopuliridis]WSC04689.1 hypothetical protein OIE62_06465 [Streptomyces scopuliridis]